MPRPPLRPGDRIVYKPSGEFAWLPILREGAAPQLLIFLAYGGEMMRLTEDGHVRDRFLEWSQAEGFVRMIDFDSQPPLSPHRGLILSGADVLYGYTDGRGTPDTMSLVEPFLSQLRAERQAVAAICLGVEPHKLALDTVEGALADERVFGATLTLG